MTSHADKIQAVIAEISEDMRLMQSKLDRLDALARQPLSESRPNRGLTDLITPGEAAKLAMRSKATINRWCIANPVDKPDGFAIFMRGRWHVSKSLFLSYLTRYPGAEPADETFER